MVYTTATLELYMDEVCALLYAARQQQDRYGDNPNPTLRAAMAALGDALDEIADKEREA